MSRLVVVSNRVPSPAARTGEAAGGLAVALRDALVDRGGLWFGWSGSVSAEPSAAPRVRRTGLVDYAVVDLTEADMNDYYAGFANSTLWPLLHYRLGLMEYRRSAADAYARVNRYFAERLIPLCRPGDMIWVQDYHLIPLGRELRRLGWTGRIGFFLHTPFPSADVVAALPHAAGLLAAFGAYNLVGVQTGNDARLLQDAVLRLAPAAAAAEGGVVLGGHMTEIRAVPISIDSDRYARLARRQANSAETARFIGSLSGRRLMIGVDRLDYSKGLPQRFQAYSRLLEAHPRHRSQVTYLQLAPISRDSVGEYRQLRRELERLCGAVNGRFSELDWNPLRYLNRTVARSTLAGLYRSASVGLVTPLRDGMNLVAKEFVAAQDGADPGVLVLSRFAGAACEMEGALLVNPMDVEEMADAIDQALDMGLAERQERWRASMAALRRNTVSDWADAFLRALDPRPAETSPALCHAP